MVKMYISVSNHTEKTYQWVQRLIFSYTKQQNLHTWNMKITQYHTVVGYVYIYDIPASDSKPKSKYPDENKNRYKLE